MDCYWHCGRSWSCAFGYCNWSGDVVDAEEKEKQKGNKTVRN